MSNKTDIYRFRAANQDQRGERIADGALSPGHYLYRLAGKIKIFPTAGAKAPLALFGRDREFQGDTGVDLDAAYTTAQLAFFDQYYQGDTVNCVLTTSQTIVVDDYLTPAGDGTFKKAGTVAAVAASAVTGTVGANTGITYTANTAGTAGNLIEVQLVDPSANSQALAVLQYDNFVRVSLKTGSGGAIESTAAEVIAAINAVPGIRITAANTGASTGAGVVAAVAAFALASGADATVDEYVLIANEAVTTTTATKRCEATVL